MYCAKCGQQNPDDAFFCHGCGARLDGERTVEQKLAADNKKRIKTILGMIVVVVCIGIAAFAYLWITQGYKRIATKYMHARYDADAKGIVSLVPDEVVDYLLKDTGHENDKNAFIAEFNEVLQESLESMKSVYAENSGDKVEISYKITEVNDCDADALALVKSYYNDWGIDVDISEVKTIRYDLTFRDTDTNTSQTENSIVTVIRVDGTWYLEYFDIGMVFY
jgi:predicted nucleic acid-binding protein